MLSVTLIFAFLLLFWMSLHRAEWCFSDWFNAACRIFIVILIVIMLSYIMLSFMLVESFSSLCQKWYLNSKQQLLI